MKHPLSPTLLLVALFLASQAIGLAIVDAYIDRPSLQEGKVEFSELPFIERPQVEESQAVWYVLSALLLGTGLILLIIRFRKRLLWKMWYALSVVVTLMVALAAFFSPGIAFLLAAALGWWKIFRPHWIIHNGTELLIYGGLAGIFVPMLNVWTAAVLISVISVYDMYAVWKSKHMVKIAEFSLETKAFAGMSIPYAQAGKKVRLSGPVGKKKAPSRARSALLGGGDLGFPLLFSGAVYKGLILQGAGMAFTKALVVAGFAGIALLLLLVKGKKDRFYPAMPFLSAGAFLGYGITLLF